jgi:hypothetical protein
MNQPTTDQLRSENQLGLAIERFIEEFSSLNGKTIL